MHATEPDLVHPDDAEREPPELVLRNARHPLLTGTVVPISVRLGGDFSILVITGPNTGGKTVALKTVGLLTAMAQAGLQVPADPGSRVRVFDAIYADIGDEQSIEQSLSTFSSHLSHIIEILGEATPNSLVLLDELGAGTDPTEGSALARAILEHLRARAIPTIGTTHYSELKAYAHTTPGVANASVEFDVRTLSPTYRLSIGLPGRSNALAIATRLGLAPEIIEVARGLLSEGDVQVERLLAEIQRERDRAAAARAEAEDHLRRADEQEKRLRQRLRLIDRERADVLRAARQAADAELREVREQLRRAATSIERAATAGGPLADAVNQLRAAEKVVEEKRRVERPPAPVAPIEETPVPPVGQARVGDAVRVRSLDQIGTLVALGHGGDAEVQLGSFKVRVPVADLEKTRPVATRHGGVSYVISAGADNAPSSQIELRGWRAEQVTPELDKYLNQAYLAGLPWVRIVHGKGTGALRQVVREYLSAHPLVRSFETAPPREGGEGVTVANMGN